jgi:hypothetical protein
VQSAAFFWEHPLNFASEVILPSIALSLSKGGSPSHAKSLMNLFFSTGLAQRRPIIALASRYNPGFLFYVLRKLPI